MTSLGDVCIGYCILHEIAHCFVKSSRGGDTLVVENFAFRMDKRMPNGRRYWKCQSTGCKATAITDGNDMVRACTAVAHNHQNNDVEIKRQKFKGDLKDEVISKPSIMYVLIAHKLVLHRDHEVI